MSEVDAEDPFHRISFIPDQTKSPGAKRTAFRKDPHGMIVVGEASVCQITRNEGQVIKSGSRVLAEEGRALQFAHSIGLPVPIVHEVRTGDRGATIAIDFVDGECLEEAWPLMTAEQKRSIAEQIRDIITTMRQAKPTQDVIGAFGGQARGCRQYSDYTGGPFNNEADFNDFVLDFLRGTPSVVRSTIANAFDVNNRIMFTHGDLSPRNIIVKDGCVQALLDWEFSGWYPEYWEYVNFFARRTDCKDWRDYGELMFETRYPKELLTFQALARWQRP